MSIEGVSAKVNLSEGQPLWRKTLRRHWVKGGQASANLYPSRADVGFSAGLPREENNSRTPSRRLSRGNQCPQLL